LFIVIFSAGNKKTRGVFEMNFKKSIGSVLTTLFIITSLAACGTTDNGTTEPKKVVTGSKGETPAGIVAGKLTPALENVVKEGKLTYIFTIKNDKEVDDVLKYTSSQQYDYKLVDSKGNIAYTYSMDKLFMQALSEQTLKPGEIVQFEIDLSEDLKKLSPGTYQFEVWSTATDREDLKAKAEFNWGGEGEGLEEEAGKLGGAVVTYVGLMDQNSIEVINEKGEHEHYRLSDTVKPVFETLEKDAKLTIHYGITSDGQKIIEEVITE
jgi:archaellum component FlaG (FlaF/FlaG flagellin family)